MNIKYRPYLTISQMKIAISLMAEKLNDKTKLILPSEKQDILDMFYMMEDTIRKAERGTMKPAYVPSTSAVRASSNISAVNMFSDEEIIVAEKSSIIETPKVLTDHEILANASEYEQDLIFLNNDLNMGFISKELYDSKLVELQKLHNITT